MSTRSERDRQKALQERHQAILAKLLKDDDNKYCVDCDAKGPRWASWNLGIFLCIRCAGIHRNLGVHISKVKSVNLDTWTPEQIAMMEEMGNSRARAVYEANLPDHVRRPQTDSSLEAFIRAKYEQKKYIAKEWVPPKPKIPQYTYDEFGDIVERPTKPKKTTTIEEPKKEKRRTRPKQSSIQLSAPASTSSKTEPSLSSTSKPEPVTKKENVANLLALDDPVPSSNGPAASNDIFNDFMSAPVSSSSTVSSGNVPSAATGNTQQTTDSSVPASTSSSGLDEAFFSEGGGESGKSTKDSIMALFANNPAGNQQMFGVPGGMYMQQQGQQGQPNMMMNMQNGMMPNNMGGGMMPSSNMMQQPNLQQSFQNGQQSNLMVADPVAALKSNLAVQAQQNRFPNQVPQQQNSMNWDQMASVAAMQTNMMGGNMMMNSMPQQGMMGAQQGMMMQQQPNMYNMGYMQQQPPQMSQMQNQMASLNLGGAGSMGNFQQAGGMNNVSWNTQQTGQTLSTNLWQ